MLAPESVSVPAPIFATAPVEPLMMPPMARLLASVSKVAVATAAMLMLRFALRVMLFDVSWSVPLAVNWRLLYAPDGARPRLPSP